MKTIQKEELLQLLRAEGFSIELELLENEPHLWAIHEEKNIGVLLEENEEENRWEVIAYDRPSYLFFEKYQDHVYAWPWYGDIEQGFLMVNRLTTLS